MKTRIQTRSLTAAVTLALVVATSAQAAQDPEKSLYDRLGGVFAIAAVVDHFSDAIVANPIVGKTSKNPALRMWHTQNLDRLAGLKFMRTLWVCAVAGGQDSARPRRGSSGPPYLSRGVRRGRGRAGSLARLREGASP